MNLTNLKSTLWSPIKARLQERGIEREFRYFENEAKKKGIDNQKIHAEALLKTEIQKRIIERGVNIMPKKKGDLNIVYLTPFDYWERVNIPQSLEKFGAVHYFKTDDYGYRIREQIYPDNWPFERKRLNQILFDYVRNIHIKKKVDVVISYLSGYHLLPETICKINKLGIVTTAFWLDDKMKFYGRWDGEVYEGAASVASSYDLNLTASYRSVLKYFVKGGLGYFWPEGGNPDHYKPIDLPKIYDVSFIGSKYGLRSKYINFLVKNGINVKTLGFGWPGGGVKGDDMVRIYAQSKINLGFNGQGYSMKATHLKGRDFEIPMAGCVYLTTLDEDHHRVYKLDEEIFTYSNKEEMLKKVKILLADDELRRKTELAARKRCLREHTWEHRFETLFDLSGLIKK